MSEVRENFIKVVLELLISQREAWCVHNQSIQYQEVFDFAAIRGISIMLAVTDSRELNAAPFRITALNGDIVEFWPDSMELGLIVEIEERYKKLLAKV